MGVYKARITATHGSTVALPTKTDFVIRGLRIVGIVLDIPLGFNTSTITTGFALWIGTEQVWPTAGQWILLDNFHSYVPFRWKMGKAQMDAEIRAYTTDANNDYKGELLVLTEDQND